MCLVTVAEREREKKKENLREGTQCECAGFDCSLRFGARVYHNTSIPLLFVYIVVAASAAAAARRGYIYKYYT